MQWDKFQPSSVWKEISALCSQDGSHSSTQREEIWAAPRTVRFRLVDMNVWCETLSSLSFQEQGAEKTSGLRRIPGSSSPAQQAPISTSDRNAWKTDYYYSYLLEQSFCSGSAQSSKFRVPPKTSDWRRRGMSLELASALTATNITFNTGIKMKAELSSVCHFLLILGKATVVFESSLKRL